MKNDINNKIDKMLKCIDEEGGRDLRDVSNEDKDNKWTEKKEDVHKLTKLKERVFKMMAEFKARK